MKSLLFTILLFSSGSFGKTETVVTRFKTPVGYHQVYTKPGSFAAWLQKYPVKPAGTPTLNYLGKVARTNAYTAAVLDISIGNQDLQQCADAIIRLRAEYLFSKKDYKAISFNFNSGFKCDFIHFAEGYRYQQSGVWKLRAKRDYSPECFSRYLTLVFSYAGSIALDKQLQKVSNIDELKAGDVFIKGGSPGHCFLVMNVVSNAAKKKLFLLAQSYIPAQNIQVLKGSSAWFGLEQVSNIPYGELVNETYLKRFD
jgi:hypothetical protein